MRITVNSSCICAIAFGCSGPGPLPQPIRRPGLKEDAELHLYDPHTDSEGF
ncbi:MAG: hypothetical protein V3T05_09210 [Myxococcota bacterium]